MAQEYKLKDISSLADIKNNDKVESEVEGIQDGKVLVVKFNDKAYAMGPKCTHYGAPLKLGVVAPDGRITCPWHGACFNVGTGDVEDAPAPNSLNTYEIFERNGAVYIKGEEAMIKSGQRDPTLKCSAPSQEKVVIVGGGSGALGVLQSIRQLKYTGSLTMISREPNLIIDRTKLSKALIPDAEEIQWRPRQWYQDASIDTVSDDVTSVDFNSKTVTTASGNSIPYTKLVLATGGVPRTLPLEGFKGELANIFLLRTIPDVQSILAAVGDKNKKIVIIGSSFIGMEVGNALSSNNDVTIVGQEKAPMERVMGEQVGRIFQRNLEKAGVKFHLQAGVARATPSSSDSSTVGAVHLSNGTVLPADLVILGVGVRPATDFLQSNTHPAINLEKDGSLKTDEHFAVSGLNNSVFAIGDIATFPYHGPGTDPKTGTHTRIEHWNVAQNAGRAVARAIIHSLSSPSLDNLKPKSFIPIFWSALGAQLRYCGNTPNGWDGLVLRGEPDNAKFAAFYCKGETVVAVATMGMDPVMAKCAELMRRGGMPGKGEIEGGVDVLGVDL
ncbi:putative AIF-like mitochondrial oxidoreductase [Aspergillus campestris IBT 28561]|uniref:AIF-like mitochondrial oxidoreductase n=1 Tax=Aspergillus campestris (strain IBT 28561) TaxID=1392248 RepID=A0A2I1CSL6_ASPC2|nr:putative AIF-like mitochondrial oxidoreductase [Aspergillus campestris IBT 28561]PKY00620.1 putative AIF-like mitochondrial oxidoreductase [Aspergillus campestris IBT 28561]